MDTPIDMSVPPPSHQPQVAVVSSLYCSPSSSDLAIVRKGCLTSKIMFVVTDLSDNIFFKVKGSGFTRQYHISLLDAAGNTILTWRPKKSWHTQWNAYRGESSDEKDLLFTVKFKSTFKTSKLDVFLANNVSKDLPDFRVETNWSRTSCVIHAGDSNSVVAQISQKCAFFGKDKYKVTVHPNVDAAFVTAIMVILDEIFSSE